MHHAVGCAFLFGVGLVETGKLFERLDHRPTDQVRVRYPTQAEDGAVLVDDAAVFVHHLDGDGALRGGEGDGNAGRHVFGDPAGGAAQGLQLAAGGRLECGFCRRPGSGRLGGRGLRRRSDAAARVKHFFPAFVYGGAVEKVLAVKLFFEPAIDAHLRIGIYRHAGDTFLFMITCAAGGSLIWAQVSRERMAAGTFARKLGWLSRMRSISSRSLRRLLGRR